MSDQDITLSSDGITLKVGEDCSFTPFRAITGLLLNGKNLTIYNITPDMKITIKNAADSRKLYQLIVQKLGRG
jgi:hypothetical protein